MNTPTRRKQPDALATRSRTHERRTAMPTSRKTSPRSPRSRSAQVPTMALQDAARYQEFFENANDALALFTTDGKIALINRAAEHLLGYARAELLGQHYRKVVTAASAKEAAERSRKALAKEPLQSTFEAELVRKDGSLVRVEARDRLVWDEAGNLVGFQGIYRDITERTRAEQQLRASEARYRTIFAVSPDFIYLTDATGHILDANPALLARVGVTREQIQHRHVLEFFAGEHPEEVHTAMGDLLAGKPLESFVTKARDAKGDVAIYEINAMPLREGDTITQIVNLARDVTKRIHDEKALRTSEERYRNVSESIADYAFSFAVENDDLRLEWLTERFTAITGYTVDEVRASPTPLALYMHPDDIPRISALIRTLPPEQQTTYEFRLRTKDGDERWIESRARAIHDTAGQLTRLYGAATDITEQKQQEEALRESRQLLERMAETVPDMIYTYDLAQHAFVYVNPQIFSILGDHPAEVVHQPDALFRARVHGADRERLTERDTRLAQAADGEVITTELRLKHKRGGWRSLRFRESVTLRTETGAPRQIVGTAQDITERQWLEDLLRERVLDRTEFPARLKAFRTGLRLSQAQFGAQFGGYNQPQISSYEGGDSGIPLGLLLAIREKGYPVEAILGGGSPDVVRQTATYLPTQQHKKLLVRALLESALRLVTDDYQTAATLLQGLGMAREDGVAEPLPDLAQVLQELQAADKREA